MRNPFFLKAGGAADYVVDAKGRVRTPGWKPRWRSAAALLAASGVCLAGGYSQQLGSGVLALGRAASATAADVISRRSPGLKRLAASYKGKPVQRARPAVRRIAPAKRIAAPAPVARPLALSAAPAAPAPLAFYDFDIAPSGPVQVAGPFPTYPLEEQLVFIPPDRFPNGGILIGGGGILPPGGGGGGVIKPPPGIPEADSWAMMILGFAILGTAWRRRRIIVRTVSDMTLLRLTYVPVRARDRSFI